METTKTHKAIFQRAKKIAKERRSENEKILFAILFSSLFSTAPTWRKSIRSFKRALYPGCKSYIIGDTPEKKPTVLVANTKDASHYRKVAGSITSLFEKNDVSTVRFRQKWKRYSIRRHISIILSFILFIIWMVGRIRPKNRAEWSHMSRLLPKIFNSYKEAKSNRKSVSTQLKKLQGVVVINEDWLPASSLIKYAKDNDVKTIHYPHGAILKVNLPLISDVQLFWNDQMKKQFCNNKNCYSIGFLEMYGETRKEDKSSTTSKEKFDILVTSQMKSTRTEYDERFKDIFKVISKLNEDVIVAIKMHPFDTDKDRLRLEKIMQNADCKHQIFNSDEVSLKSLLQKARLHVTVNSGATLVANKLGVPSLLYGESEHLRLNGLDEKAVYFESVTELEEALEKNYTSEKLDWVQDECIERKFRQFVFNELVNISNQRL